MPQVVRNSSEHITEFDKSIITDSVFNEINYVAKFLELAPQITKSEAHQVATRVEKSIQKQNITVLSGPLIRELVNIELLKMDSNTNGKNHYRRRFYTRVGLPIADAIKIEHNDPEYSTENANQAENPETIHKKFGDAVAKEKALLILPHHLADAHLIGDLHIHDLEYFTSRPFCMDWDLRFFFYYGLDSDCTGKTNIASAAQHANVAFLHAAKILGSAQTNFAGGQGYYNFLTFIAPYLKDMPYKEIKQLIQMFIFEISQSMVARGAQVVFSSVQLSPGVPTLWKNIPAVYKGKVWNGKNGIPLQTYGDFEPEIRLAYRAMMEVMLGGDAWGRMFNFPKPEIAVEEEFLIPEIEDTYYQSRQTLKNSMVDFPKHEINHINTKLEDLPMTYSELYDLTIELVAKFGTPYFDNMIPEYRNMDKNSIQCYQCLDGSEEVITNEGKIQIEQLYNNLIKTEEYLDTDVIASTPRAQCLTTKGMRPFKGVKRTLHNGEMYKITTESNHSITCTPEHNLFTVNGPTKASELKIGNTILVSVRCKICEKEVKMLTNTHLIKHNMTLKEYIEIYGIEGTVGDQLRITRKRKGKSMECYWSTQSQEYIDSITKLRIDAWKEYWSKLTPEEKSQQKKDAAIGRWDNMSDEMKRKTVLGPRKINNHEPTKQQLLLKESLQKILPNSDIICDKKFKNNTIQKNAMPWKVDICIDNKVAIECDGMYWHSLPHVIEKDERKDTDLMEQGLIVLRFWNHEVDTDISKCTNKIVDAVKANSRYEEIISIESIQNNNNYVYDLVEVHGTHSFITGNNIVSSNCCAFSFSTVDTQESFNRKLNFINGEHFSMGGMQVITLNLPRVAYKSKQNNFESLMGETRKIINNATEIQLIKRRILKGHWDSGHLPFASQRLTHVKTKEVSPTAVDFDSLVFPIGIIGLNEVAKHHTSFSLETQEGFEFTVKYMNHIKAYIHQKAKEENILLVFARTPAEQVAQKFAVSDLIHYPEKAKKVVCGDINKAMLTLKTSKNLPVYYTNGTHLPINTSVPITDRIRIEGTFFPILEGGNIFHIWLGESKPNIQGLKEFIFNIIKKTPIGYFTLTKDFSICDDCKEIEYGLIDTCKKCNSTHMNQYSRITGYIQLVKGWNDAKKHELRNRTRTLI